MPLERKPLGLYDPYGANAMHGYSRVLFIRDTPRSPELAEKNAVLPPGTLYSGLPLLRSKQQRAVHPAAKGERLSEVELPHLGFLHFRA